MELAPMTDETRKAMLEDFVSAKALHKLPVFRLLMRDNQSMFLVSKQDSKFAVTVHPVRFLPSGENNFPSVPIHFSYPPFKEALQKKVFFTTLASLQEFINNQIHGCNSRAKEESCPRYFMGIFKTPPEPKLGLTGSVCYNNGEIGVPYIPIDLPVCTEDLNASIARIDDLLKMLDDSYMEESIPVDLTIMCPETFRFLSHPVSGPTTQPPMSTTAKAPDTYVNTSARCN